LAGLSASGIDARGIVDTSRAVPSGGVVVGVELLEGFEGVDRKELNSQDDHDEFDIDGDASTGFDVVTVG
jgi:hypothetical protein